MGSPKLLVLITSMSLILGSGPTNDFSLSQKDDAALARDGVNRMMFYLSDTRDLHTFALRVSNRAVGLLAVSRVNQTTLF
jgi:hypothetical protein